MPARKSREELIAAARRHIAVEGALDLEATLATMEPPYYFELWPRGLRMEGIELVRSYYRYHFATVRPRMLGMDAVAEWESEHGLVLERRLRMRSESGTTENFPILTVLSLG